MGTWRKKRNQQRPSVEYIGQNLYIRPHCIVSLPEYCGASAARSTSQRMAESNLKDNSTEGLLSSKAVSRMKTAINWLLCAAQPKDVYDKRRDKWFRFKVGFVTLTLPSGNHQLNGYELQSKLLNPWLTYMRTYHGLGNYVWKLEYQQNGNLHVHITMDAFIHYAKIRSAWNRLLCSNGLIDAYQKKFFGCSFEDYCSKMPRSDKRSQETRLKAWNYGNETGWRDPNTTDVHSVRKIRDMAAYLYKYMAKSIGDISGFRGRIWGCSRRLSQAINTRCFINRNECGAQLRQLMVPEIKYSQITGVNKITGLPRLIGEVFYLKFTDWVHKIKHDIRAAFDNTILMLQAIAGTQQQMLIVD